MAAKRHERTRARRSALQVLYSGEITETSPTAIAEGDGYLEGDGPLPEYALTLVRGVEAHQNAIDGYLAATSENWSLGRMPIVDRSILRLATFEMMFVDDVPVSVTINEAVELAKDFGGEDESPRFVNGVLGRIAKRLGGDGEAAEDGAAAGGEDSGADEVAADGERTAAEDEVIAGDEVTAPCGVTALEGAADVAFADRCEAVADEESEGAFHGA